MGKRLHLLWFHTKDDVDEDDGLLIGVYATESDAQSAVERLRNKPGFSSFPKGFRIHSRELGEDSWTEGFVVDELTLVSRL